MASDIAEVVQHNFHYCIMDGGGFDPRRRSPHALIISGRMEHLTGVDAAVGMIREELSRQGLDKNTVIIFTSDNGYNAGSHGFGDKVIPYEEGSKAPLIIYDPRLPAEKNGKSCAAVTGNIDMAATIFALAGEPAPEGIDGKSLLPLLTNPAAKVRDFLPLFNFWGIPSAQSMAIVTPEWKYIHWYYGEGMKPTEELFHLSGDRDEMTNSAGDAKHSVTLETMRRQYDAELGRYRPASRPIPWLRKISHPLQPHDSLGSKGRIGQSQEGQRRLSSKARQTTPP